MILFAPAKINVGLKVLNKRPDAYHNLDTIFYSLPLYDILEFGLSDRFNLKTSGLRIGGNLKDNLIYKAYDLMCKRHKIS